MKVNLPVHKGEVLDVTIMDLTYQGMGVAKVDNLPNLYRKCIARRKNYGQGHEDDEELCVW